MMQEIVLNKRQDGKYEEKLDDKWVAEYFEDPLTGLFQVEILHHDATSWFATDYPSLEDAQEAAHEYYDTQVS